MRKPDDFEEYWGRVTADAGAFTPEAAISPWELEDPAFQDEYVIDGRAGDDLFGADKGAGAGSESATGAQNPFDCRWNSRAIITGLSIKKVRFASFDGQPVGGILQCPKTGGRRRYPGIVHFTGYGGELMVDQDFVSAGYAVFNFSHRGMLMGSDGFDRYRPVPLLVRDVDDRERYAYRSIVIDCLLAVAVMGEMDAVDGNRIGVMGMSQGAALALITSVLSDRVAAVSCDLPWLTDFEWQLAHEPEGPYNEIKEYIRRYPEKRDAALRTLGYFDTVNFAAKVEKPVIVSLGLEDRVCSPESVRSLFGRIGSVKMLLELPGIGHERSSVWRSVTRNWFDFHL
jgi:cephalosporin-C deacetylase